MCILYVYYVIIYIIGKPKGVKLSHKNVLSNTLQFGIPDDSHDTTNGKQYHKDVILSPLPFYHVYGFISSLSSTMYQGIIYICY